MIINITSEEVMGIERFKQASVNVEGKGGITVDQAAKMLSKGKMGRAWSRLKQTFLGGPKLTK